MPRPEQPFIAPRKNRSDPRGKHRIDPVFTGLRSEITSRIRDLLSITKLLTVFETFDAEGEAVQSFTSVNV